MSTHTNIDSDLNSKTAADKVQEAAEQAGQKINEATSVAKEQAKRAASQVTDQAKSTVDTRMSEVAHEVDSVADAVRQTTYEIGGDSQTVARYGERIAEQLDTVSSYLNEKGVEDVLSDLQEFARRQPAVFLGGAFMLGMVVGRFMRSTSNNIHNRDMDTSYDHYNDEFSQTGSVGTYGYNDYQSRNRYHSGLAQESTTSQG